MNMIKTMTFLFTTALVKPVFAFSLVATNAGPNFSGWSNSDIDIYVNPSNCPASVDLVSIVEEALQYWNNVPTSKVKLKYAGLTSATTQTNPPSIYCETNFQAVTGADQSVVSGVAQPNSNSERIVSGNIALNVSAGQGNVSNSSRTILVYVMAHEMGHLIGLGHSESQSALMYYSYGTKDRVALSQDDIDGISYLYPSSESGSNLAGCGTLRPLGPPSSGMLLMIGLAFGLPLMTLAYLRRRIIL